MADESSIFVASSICKNHLYAVSGRLEAADLAAGGCGLSTECSKRLGARTAAGGREGAAECSLGSAGLLWVLRWQQAARRLRD